MHLNNLAPDMASIHLKNTIHLIIITKPINFIKLLQVKSSLEALD